MLWTKNCYSVAFSSVQSRVRLMATVVPGMLTRRRMCTETPEKKSTFVTDSSKQYKDTFEEYKMGLENDTNDLLTAYRTTDFNTALLAAPKPVFWTAVLSITPLAAKTLVAVLTLNCDDYASVAMEYVSLYVVFANGWWLGNGGGHCGPAPSASFMCLQRAIAPSTLCLVSALMLPQFVGVVTVSYAAFMMICRLVANKPGAVTELWGKSLVLLLYGLNASYMSVALLCAVIF